MRFFVLNETSCVAYQTPEELPQPLPPKAFLWISLQSDTLTQNLNAIETLLLRYAKAPLLELHAADLISEFIPSTFDATQNYRILIFRQLAHEGNLPPKDEHPSLSNDRILERVETHPTGFVCFDQVLLSVHPKKCLLQKEYAEKLLAFVPKMHNNQAKEQHLPQSPADLMLRQLSLLVDDFLTLRRELSQRLDFWQEKLLDPNNQFVHWVALLDARRTLHYLDDICEDQENALTDFLESPHLQFENAIENSPENAYQKELLNVRGRDVLEHITRVGKHVARLEQTIESAIQIHFSAQGSRTNDIMRVLPVLTAVFLPLNLLTGIFGMNFEVMPIHHAFGFWLTLGGMLFIVLVLSLIFKKKGYLGRWE